MPDAWKVGDSPFHKGEQEAQDRVGVRDKLETFGRRVIRDYLPDQHREFYQTLPFVLLGTVDAQGRPWASIFAGRPGFLTTPDDRHLEIAAQPLFGDPLNDTLKPDAEVGILGIEPATRRRNRMTGRVSTRRPDSIAIKVGQSFGNCPQYIQTREIELLPDIDEPKKNRKVFRSDRFDSETRELIERSDTLFIATAYSTGSGEASEGADVSHRGGKPGFVRVDDERSFVFPDFSGNFHFNTIGNILANPKAGFLFMDFDNGDLVYLTGSAEIVWEGEEIRAFAGAERLIRFTAAEVIRVVGSLPMRFRFGEYSPVLAQTGSWQQADETIAANRERNRYLPYEIFDVQTESDAITSFYLRRADGKALASYEPGQFLPLRLSIPGEETPVTRTYTVSDAPDSSHYRLSIKREGGDALVSNYLHDHATPGFRLEAMAPRGKFVLDQSSDRPVVLLSAGVGITPMIAMANHIIREGVRTRNFRRTFFIHGAKNGRVRAFDGHLRQLASEHESLTLHTRLSDPSGEDRLGETYDSKGHVDIDLLKTLLPLDDYEFYLCGPAPFMETLYKGLADLGVREERIHYESFGPATVLKRDPQPAQVPVAAASGSPVKVQFAESDIEIEWTPDKGTLLDLAQEAGLYPDYSCRSGICGTCATRIACGAVDYIEEPSASRAEDEVLICCSTPRSVSGAATCGEDRGVILGL